MPNLEVDISAERTASSLNNKPSSSLNSPIDDGDDDVSMLERGTVDQRTESSCLTTATEVKTLIAIANSCLLKSHKLSREIERKLSSTSSPSPSALNGSYNRNGHQNGNENGNESVEKDCDCVDSSTKLNTAVIVRQQQQIDNVQGNNDNNKLRRLERQTSDLPEIIINTNSFDCVNIEDDYLESETTTLSSTPTSNAPEHDLHFDEALIQEKFDKLGLSQYLNDVEIDDSTNVQDSNNNEKSRIPLLRSISLKTGKTPPNTPSQKKFVRFADSLGLELAFVKNIYQEDIPNVPKSAFHDLKLPDETISQPKYVFSVNQDNSNKFSQRFISQPTATLWPEFVQPCVLSNFLGRIRQQKVCLENCLISSGSTTINVTCIIRVLNISFEKDVTIRYTFDEWQRWTDLKANYLSGSSDGWSDKFSVTFDVPIVLGGPVMPGQRILFALRYIANYEEFWDNNMGLNYSLIFRV